MDTQRRADAKANRVEQNKRIVAEALTHLIVAPSLLVGQRLHGPVCDFFVTSWDSHENDSFTVRFTSTPTQEP